MNAEANGKSTLGLVLGALGLSLTIVAGAWVIVDQKVENAIQKATKQDSLELTALQAKMTEIETQFRSEDQVRNIQWASTLRFETLLWEKSFPGTRFPSDVQYYPQIARDPK